MTSATAIPTAWRCCSGRPANRFPSARASCHLEPGNASSSSSSTANATGAGWCRSSETSRARSLPYPLPKRIVDKLIAALLLVVLAPVFVVAAVAAGLASGGRVFYREQRISRGKLFELLKFQTVRRDAVGESRLLERSPENLTWAGRGLLKPWYLDELPQLLNVLHGDISLV